MRKKKCIKKETLCWQCANACGRCSWSSKAHKPVTGWTAERRDITVANKPEPLESYIVEFCPEFVEERREKDKRYRKRIGIPSEKLEIIARMRAEGMTWSVIIEKMGYTERVMQKRLREIQDGYSG